MYDCLQSIKRAGSKFTVFLRHEKLPVFTQLHLEVLSEWLSLFAPLAKALDVLQKDNASIGTVLPVVAMLRKKLSGIALVHLHGLRDHLVDRIGELKTIIR